MCDRCQSRPSVVSSDLAGGDALHPYGVGGRQRPPGALLDTPGISPDYRDFVGRGKRNRPRRPWRANADERMGGRPRTREEWLWQGRIANAELAGRLLQLGLADYAKSLRQCRTTRTTLVCDYCGKPSAIPTRCKQRLCMMCAEVKSRENARAVEALTGRFANCAFITLTMRRVPLGGLADALTLLRAAFVRFRSYGAIKKRLRGGVRAIEIVYEPAGQTRDGRALTEGWHVHAHLLADSAYIPHAWLRRLWGRALGQRIGAQWDAIVDIKRASGKMLARYISKYITKPGDLLNWPDAALVEFCTTIRKRRLVATFGAYYSLGLSKLLNKPDRAPITCDGCGKVGTQFWARAGPKYYGRDWEQWMVGSWAAWGRWDYVEQMQPDEVEPCPDWMFTAAARLLPDIVCPGGPGFAPDMPRNCPEAAESAPF